MLHIINQSPFNSDSLEKCLGLIQTHDGILLIENAVVAGLSNAKFCKTISDITNTCSIYALKSDVIARGLLDNIMPEIKLIDYEQFVDLVVEYQPIQSWN